MTPVEELDLVRINDLEKAALSDGYVFSPKTLARFVKAIRLGDETRGLRVVPVEATEGMVHDAMRLNLVDDMDLGFIWRAMLAASPFAPEDKT